MVCGCDFRRKEPKINPKLAPRNCRHCHKVFIPPGYKWKAEWCDERECQNARLEYYKQNQRDYASARYAKNRSGTPRGGARPHKKKGNGGQFSGRECIFCGHKLTLQDLEKGHRFYHPSPKECWTVATGDCAVGWEEF